MSELCQHQGHGEHSLSLKGVGGSYGEKVALSEVNFETTCGHRLALLGPNGAGKSTLIRILAGLMKADAGEILWRGKSLKSITNEIAYLPQLDHHQRHFPLSVREVVAMGRFPHLGNFRKFGKQDHEIVSEVLRRMKLEEMADRQIDQLSGGQQQRSFIARALAQEAHVILLDEPFNGLDVESRCHLADTLKELSQNGHLIIASHHNLDSVTQIFDQALVLQQKQIRFGEVNEVMEDHDVRHLLHSCHPHHV